jgi:YHS domain-containing protein
MNRTLIIVTLLAALAAGCRAGSRARAARPQPDADLRTIDSANVRPAMIDAPPMLTDEAPPPKTTTNLAQADAPPPPTAQDEALRAALPFAPAIAMDAVDGSKISIRASTPTIEYKNKLYYFSTEDHKRTFLANPEQYTKGVFSHL